MQNDITVVKIIYTDRREEYHLDITTGSGKGWDGRAYVKIPKKIAKDIISSLEMVPDRETGELPITIKYLLP